MKLHSSLLVLFFSFALLSSRCKKQNTEPQLPPETTTGAMTFGCKVNGKVFVPKGSIDGPGIIAQYIYLGSGVGGGWFLNLNAANRQESPLATIGINTDSLLLLEGITYNMKEAKGYPYIIHQKGLNFFYIYPGDSGKLVITKHNQSQRIISGRFWFTATSAYDQTKISVTEGRFDVRY